MEKKIVLKMNDSKDISIVCNGRIVLTIPSEQRSIRAEQIYDLLDYSDGDHYTIEKKNDAKIDEPVLNFFFELMNDIITPLNGFGENREE